MTLPTIQLRLYHGSIGQQVPIRKIGYVHLYGLSVILTKSSLTLQWYGFLQHGAGLPQRAVTQDALRRAKGPVGTAYQELRASVQHAPVVYTDDIGWKVGEENPHLMALDTAQAPAPGGAGGGPGGLPGVMVTDRGRSYESHALR